MTKSQILKVIQQLGKTSLPTLGTLKFFVFVINAVIIFWGKKKLLFSIFMFLNTVSHKKQGYVITGLKNTHFRSHWLRKSETWKTDIENRQCGTEIKEISDYLELNSKMLWEGIIMLNLFENWIWRQDTFMIESFPLFDADGQAGYHKQNNIY